jgi:hypothetical protein
MDVAGVSNGIATDVELSPPSPPPPPLSAIDSGVAARARASSACFQGLTLLPNPAQLELTSPLFAQLKLTGFPI